MRDKDEEAVLAAVLQALSHQQPECILHIYMDDESGVRRAPSKRRPPSVYTLGHHDKRPYALLGDGPKIDPENARRFFDTAEDAARFAVKLCGVSRVRKAVEAWKEKHLIL